MEEIIDILQEIKPGIDYAHCSTLIDDGMLDSFDIISLVNELCAEFDITIPGTQIIPANFNSAAAMWAMVQALMED